MLPVAQEPVHPKVAINLVAVHQAAPTSLAEARVAIVQAEVRHPVALRVPIHQAAALRAVQAHTRPRAHPTLTPQAKVLQSLILLRLRAELRVLRITAVFISL